MLLLLRLVDPRSIAKVCAWRLPYRVWRLLRADVAAGWGLGSLLAADPASYCCGIFGLQRRLTLAAKRQWAAWLLLVFKSVFR